MTIVVAGAAGFIGYHVAERLLARGDTVLGLDNLNACYDVLLSEYDLSPDTLRADVERLPGQMLEHITPKDE
jgi:UDP-glucuronate 4-epimerase